MFKGNNILLFLFTVLPSLLYIWMFYVSIPSKKVSLPKAVNVFFIGFFSVTLVKFIHFIFPSYSSPIDPSNIILSVLFLSFIQVAFTEELCKFGSYKISGAEKNPTSNIALMFYCAIPAIAFAITENVMYISKYTMSSGIASHKSWGLSFSRNAHATTLHLTCGVIMGYFVLLGRQTLSNGKSWITRLINKTKRRRIAIYRIAGITLASIVHGAYDLNFFAAKFIPNSNTSNVKSITTLFTVFGVILMIHLVKKAVKMDKLNKPLS